MVTIYDEKGTGYSAQAEVALSKGVNGEKSLTGTLTAKPEVLNAIDRGWKIVFKQEEYIFTYAKPVDTGDDVYVDFDAVHVFFYDMSKSAVDGVLNGSHTWDRYLKFVFQGSGYTYQNQVDVKAFEKQNFGHKNRLALFYDLVKQAGVEFSINGSVVRIIERVGNDLSTVVKKGFNLNELVIEKNINDFVTYQKGYGAFYDGEDHSKGRLEVEYLSPLAEVYGRLDADPIVDERYTNRNALLNRLKANVEESYQISVQMDLEDLNRAGYEYDQPHEGDVIMAINEDIGFKREVRIVSYKTYYDFEGTAINHEVTCNSVGSVQKSISHSNGIVSAVRQLQTDLQIERDMITRAQASADGKSMIYYGPVEPDPNTNKLQIGDIWFDSSGEDTVLKYWNGYEWRQYGLDVTALNREFDRIEKEVQEAKSTAQQATDKALEEAKQHADAEIAKTEQEFGTLMQAAEADIQSAKEQADKSVNDVNQAVQNAGFTSLDEALTSTNDLISGAVRNAGFTSLDEALTSITGLESDIVQAEARSQSLISKAQTDASKALTDAQQALDDVASLDTGTQFNFSQIDDKLTLKADQTSVDSLKKTVEQNTLDLSVTSKELATKATQSSVDLINQTVNNHTTQLSQTAQELSAKANQSSVDNINSKLTTHDSRISANAQAITQRLTSVQVDNKLAGYATVSYADNKIESTAQGTRQEISRVENKIPTEIGVQNLVPNSQNDWQQVRNLTTWHEWVTAQIPVEAGQTYTYSVDWQKVSHNQRLQVMYHENGNVIRQDFDTPELYGVFQNGRHSMTITTPDNATHVSLGFRVTQLGVSNGFNWRRPKFERGTMATDWTPAVEDQATVVQLNEVKRTADSAISRISSSEGKITQLEQNLNGVQSTVASKASQSQVTQLDRSLSSVITDFNNMEIGGRNLIGKEHLSDKSANDKWIHVRDQKEWHNWTAYDVPVEAGKIYTYSLDWQKQSGNQNLEVRFLDSENKRLSTIQSSEDMYSVNQPGRYKFTFETPENATKVYLGARNASIDSPHGFNWRQPKLEKGTVATDWTPAPEDQVSQSEYVAFKNEYERTAKSVTDRLSKAETDLATKATVIQLNEVKRTADNAISRISSTDGRVTQLEQNLNGVQSTVASKASQSQVTQLDRSLSSVITDFNNMEIGGRNLIPGTSSNFIRLEVPNNNWNLWIAIIDSVEPNTTYTFSTHWQKGTGNQFLAIFERDSSNKVIKENINDYLLYHFNQKGRYSYTITTGPNTTGLNVGFRNETPNHLANYTNRVWYKEAKLEKGTVATDWTPAPEDHQSQITQNANNINARVRKNDVVNQINISTEGILIAGRKIHITGQTTIDNAVIKNAHIESINASKITAGTINTARLNASDIVTKGLTTNVVKSTHISADTALFNMLFSTSSATDRLAARSAWIGTANLKNLAVTNAKIANGTIGSAKIANLDVDKLTGNLTNFFRSNWNSATGGNVAIDGNGIVSTASGGSQTYIQNGIIGTRQPNGASIGQIGYIPDATGSPVYRLRTTIGAHFAINQRFVDSYTGYAQDKDTLVLSAGGTEGFLRTDSFHFTGGNVYIGEYNHYLGGVGDSRFTINGMESVSLRANESTVFVVSNNGGRNYASLHANLNMQGNTITNPSDERLKTDISPADPVLDKVIQFDFNNFKWKKDGREDYGVIAQQVEQVAPELVMTMEDGYKAINSTRMQLMTAQSVKEVNEKVDSQIAHLQMQLDQANRRIEELEKGA